MSSNLDFIGNYYNKIVNNISHIRKILDRPLTLSEKIIFGNLIDNLRIRRLEKDSDYIELRAQHIAMQDATAQMAILQFMETGIHKVCVPTTIHCDHLITAEYGENIDLKNALSNSKEIYDFLENVSKKYGIGFWKPGAGIIHQVIFENHAFPGAIFVGTDSHTPNIGGLGSIGIGAGGADACEIMSGLPLEIKLPKILGVHLKGKLNGWASPKDVILYLAGVLTVKGANGHIIEYFGDGASSISCTGKSTICNMGAELGATSSIFNYDASMKSYLNCAGREGIVKLADKISGYLCGDREVYESPEKYFDRVIEIDLSKIEPYINGPFSPDIAWPISDFKTAAKNNEWPATLEVGIIGSCTNSSYEDLSKSANVLEQALKNNIDIKTEYIVTPGSQKIKTLIKHTGILDIFEKAGAKIFASACGACPGQWRRTTHDDTRKNSIMTSFNRNFAGRNDGNLNTHMFIASPEIVTAFSIAGRLDFNPLTDTLLDKNGIEIKLREPADSGIPNFLFKEDKQWYIPPSNTDNDKKIYIDPNSQRLQRLIPFSKFNQSDMLKMRVLIKIKGKCTTDHISPTVGWFKYRGHLENISNNMLMRAVNYYTGEINSVKNQLNKKYGSVSDVQKFYKANNISSVIIADENYGEGSSREHAAMEPRYLGVKAVIAKSFARIHENNLKKQGILALTFKNPSDYYKILEDDVIDIMGVTEIKPNLALHLILRHIDNTTEQIPLFNSYNNKQIEWFKAGSALNLVLSQKFSD